ncbi:hypothetical protein [Nocardioides zeae]|uniref:Cytochrome C oxidase subunit IV family protein n=1 Tax=Nocardioides zeae TaxID=1457234 RepID=A0A6P0HP96_9ACTN|nr:hypothetical protein [Nocardioides zeae]NEN80458.1 hypothetical protein [Nocardioides zeae]
MSTVVAPRTDEPRRALRALGALVALTVAGLALTTDAAVAAASARGVAVVGIGLALVKVRIVLTEFVGLRDLPRVRRWFDAWLVVVGVALVVMVVA